MVQVENWAGLNEGEGNKKKKKKKGERREQNGGGDVSARFPRWRCHTSKLH